MGSLLLAAGVLLHLMPYKTYSDSCISRRKGSKTLFAECQHHDSSYVHRVVSSRLSACFLEPSGDASGQASDIAIHAREILRVRQLLTGIYQRHCAKLEETEATGLERFGSYHPTTL
jgi:hypothetical protein